EELVTILEDVVEALEAWSSLGQDFGRVDWSVGADGAGPAWIVDREELVANPKAVLEVLEEWSSVCLGLEGP
ncbi:hypothetical protein BGZ52_011612, partial [Haplosporangium bisporale]